MATLAYPYSVRDSANTTTDNRKTGLTPTVSNGKTLASSPATVLASTVTVVEVGAGDYVALYDAETNLDASFPVDWGAGLTNPNDRYGTLLLTRDAGRVISYLTGDAFARVGANGSGLTSVGLSGTQAFNNTGQTTKNPVTLAASDVTGNVAADVQTFKTQAVTCAAPVTVLASVGTASASTAQTGDAYARIGANGANLTALGDTRIANLDAAISTRSIYAGGDTSGTTALLAIVRAQAIALTGTVAASPAPTAAGFTVTLDSVSQLAAGAAAAGFTKCYLTFVSGSKNAPEPLLIASATINSTSSVAFTFASPGFAATPAAGEGVVVSG